MLDPLKQEYQRRKNALNNPKLQLIFSAMTGEIYPIEKDEIYSLENYQVPVKKYPNNKCKLCFGRGHVGKDPKTSYMLPCPKCVPRIVDYAAIQRIQEMRLKNANLAKPSEPIPEPPTPVKIENPTNG